MSNVPERSFVLIEDIDAAFNKRVQTSEDGYASSFASHREHSTKKFCSYQSSVTFSGFLNALDGVASGEERVIFMTTNHVDKLDPALIRPGRVDLMEHIDDASPEQARRLFERFFSNTPDLADDKVLELSRTLGKIVEEEMMSGRRISMAALQGLFIRQNAQEALAQSRSLFVSRRA